MVDPKLLSLIEPPCRRKVSNTFSELDPSCTMGKSPAKRERVKYDELGRLLGKRTRAVSRAQEEEAKSLERLETSKFYCTEKGCPVYFENFEVFNLHQRVEHGMLALYFCDYCQQSYTTSEFFKLHKKSHDIHPLLCTLCECLIKNQEALQQHLDEHAKYSVPCKYCDKSFLDKRTCESHSRSAHSGRRKRIIRKDTKITGRVDKDLENREDTTNNLIGRQYTIYYFPYTDMAYSSGDLDITPENFQLMNMDFITKDGRNEQEPYFRRI